MSLDDLVTPVVAENLAAFGPGSAGTAAKLNYDVPLPGAYSWERIVPLDLPPEYFGEGAAGAGTSLIELGVVAGDQGALESVDRDRLVALYRRALPESARPSLRLVSQVGGEVEPLLAREGDGRLAVDGDKSGSTRGLRERRELLSEPDDVVRQQIRLTSYLDRLAEREASQPILATATMLTIPMPGLGASVRPVTVNPVAAPVPRLALVETWELRSFLGDFGLGRTLQTFSLLPGERTTITAETWQSSSATREDASSIFDSSDSAAQTRFTSALTTESGSATQDQGGWALSVSTSASAGVNLGIVSVQASLAAGFAANHQEASQRWSSAISQAAHEHAAQVNNSRRQSVQSTSSTTSASGSATTVVRELSNTNLRRVLNFVFRELNQEYETYVVLKDIKVAFYNGNPGSVDIVPLAELPALLGRHVNPRWQEIAARQILAMCAERLDAAGNVVATLEVGQRPQGAAYTWTAARLGRNGELDFQGNALDSDVRWRFARDIAPIDGHDVDGVVMEKSTVVLRTDNMVVEALLGQADALDPYGTALQALDLLKRQAGINAENAETRRTEDALALVAAQAAGDRVDAWQKLFPDEPEIEVVPVAAVNHNHTP